MLWNELQTAKSPIFFSLMFGREEDEEEDEAEFPSFSFSPRGLEVLLGTQIEE